MLKDSNSSNLNDLSRGWPVTSWLAQRKNQLRWWENPQETDDGTPFFFDGKKTLNNHGNSIIMFIWFLVLNFRNIHASRGWKPTYPSGKDPVYVVRGMVLMQESDCNMQTAQVLIHHSDGRARLNHRNHHQKQALDRGAKTSIGTPLRCPQAHPWKAERRIVEVSYVQVSMTLRRSCH